jgi:hypothetical protein
MPTSFVAYACSECVLCSNTITTYATMHLWPPTNTHTKQSHLSPYVNSNFVVVPAQFQCLILKSSPHARLLACVFWNCLFWTKDIRFGATIPDGECEFVPQRKYAAPTCSYMFIHVHLTGHTHMSRAGFMWLSWWSHNIPLCTVLCNLLRLRIILGYDCKSLA